METQTRSVRIPLDNCPQCGSDHTVLVEAKFTEPEITTGQRPTTQASYSCWLCEHTWSTCWATEYNA